MEDVVTLRGRDLPLRRGGSRASGTLSWSWAWGPVLGWAALIFALSSLPGGVVAVEIPGVDKLAHAGVFGVLALVILRALGGVTRWSAARCVVCAIACVAVYGALDELHQWITPQRSVELLDVGADVAGGAVAAALWLIHRRIVRGHIDARGAHRAIRGQSDDS